MKTLLHSNLILSPFSRRVLVLVALCMFVLVAGCGGPNEEKAEYGYITAPSIALRDRVAAVYNKVAFLNNGDRVRVIERSANKRFVKVRSDDNKEGWIPQRYIVGQDVFDAFQKLSQQHAKNESQASAVTRRIVNMHSTAAREGPTLYQLKEGERLELLKRASAPKVAPKPVPKAVEPTPVDEDKDKAKEGEDEDEPAKPSADVKSAPKAKAKVAAPIMPSVPMEDWWLVRDSRKRVGWVLGRMMDVEIPLEIAQYAEGQRIVASHVLSEVPERGAEGDKLIPQYLVLMSENKDGMPFDFNQVRIFTWNTKRDRYETAYRERLQGELPFRAGVEAGNPFFVLKAKDADGQVTDRKYRMNGVMVRRVTDEKAGPKPATSAPAKPAKASAKGL
ncbi:MAG TPA: SH3 domain-containing protein [Terriglobales bacterium]|nr:SH3 domain-containing protein [Terriglobales bacterium]